MWFYGMVGNSQFRDPWLDEAFATWAEALVNPLVRPRTSRRPSACVGASAPRWTTSATGPQYFARVYGKGGAALLEARERAGAEAFDAAIRCYVESTAWTHRDARGRRRGPRRPARGARRPDRGRRPRRGRRPGELLLGRAQQPLHPGDALDQVVVAQRVGHPQVARGPERLAGDDGHLGLLQDQLGQLDAGLRRPARRSDRPSSPFTEG